MPAIAIGSRHAHPARDLLLALRSLAHAPRTPTPSLNGDDTRPVQPASPADREISYEEEVSQERAHAQVSPAVLIGIAFAIFFVLAISTALFVVAHTYAKRKRRLQEAQAAEMEAHLKAVGLETGSVDSYEASQDPPSPGMYPLSRGRGLSLSMDLTSMTRAESSTPAPLFVQKKRDEESPAPIASEKARD